MSPQELVAHHKLSRPFHKEIPIVSFLRPNVFLTRQGHCGVTLRINGIDDECVSDERLDSISNALMNAVRVFDGRFRLYQYLVKRGNSKVESKSEYPNAAVASVIRDRIAHIEANNIANFDLLLVVVHETNMGQRGKVKFSSATASYRETINAATDELLARAAAFCVQCSAVNPQLLANAETFWLLRYLVNLGTARANMPLKRPYGVDVQACASRLDWDNRGRLTLDEKPLKVLTLKELPSFTTPNLFRELMALPCDFVLCSEWQRKDSPILRKDVSTKRTHLWNFKRRGMAEMAISALSKNQANRAAADDPDLEDDSARILIRHLKRAMAAVETENGKFGKFSWTMLLHGADVPALTTAVSEVTRILSDFEAEIVEETYGALSAYFAMLPGNSSLNVRRWWLQDNHYADLSFAFTPLEGSLKSSELDDEYLTVFETQQGTPFYFDPYYNHSFGLLILGPRGTGKSVTGNTLVTDAQKFGGFTYILDVGGSFETTARHFGGQVLQLSLERQSFKINPFSLDPTPNNLQFIFNFVLLLMSHDGEPLTRDDKRLLYEAIVNMYRYEGKMRRLSTLAAILGALGDRLEKWVHGGQYGVLFDHADDTLRLSRFVAFDLQGVEDHPEIIEPVLYWLFRQIRTVIRADENQGTFKLLAIDELWKYLKNPKVVEFVDDVIKTGRKHLVGTILMTQSLGDLGPQAEMIRDNCKMTMFLANPDVNRVMYAERFDLNSRELDLIATLQPRRILLKTPEFAKVLTLNLDPKAYWRSTTSAKERVRRDRAIAQYGDEAIELLAGGAI